MKLLDGITLLLSISTPLVLARDPLTYAPEPAGLYAPPRNQSVVTLLDLIQSRSELSTLAEAIKAPAG